MRALLIAAALTLGSASFASAQPCTTVQPGPDWRCVNGGWLPANQTPAPAPPVVDVPTPTTPTSHVPFKIGHRYWRNASGVNPTDIYIAGAGQLADGTAVLFAVCRSVGDGCYAAGEVRMLPANATARDWEDRTNSPY